MDRGTSRGCTSWGVPLRRRRRSCRRPPMPPASAHRRRPDRTASPADRGPAQVAGADQDQLLELLDRTGADLCLDPAALRQFLAVGSDAHRVGAQLGVEDGDGQLDPLVGRLRIDVPIGDDHATVRVDRGERHELDRREARLPQIAVDADRRHPRRCQRRLNRFLAVVCATGERGQRHQRNARLFRSSANHIELR